MSASEEEVDGVPPEVGLGRLGEVARLAGSPTFGCPWLQVSDQDPDEASGAEVSPAEESDGDDQTTEEDEPGSGGEAEPSGDLEEDEDASGEAVEEQAEEQGHEEEEDEDEYEEEEEDEYEEEEEYEEGESFDGR